MSSIVEGIKSLLRAQGFSDPEIVEILDRLVDALEKDRFNDNEFRAVFWREFGRSLADKQLGTNVSEERSRTLSGRWAGRLEGIVVGVTANKVTNILDLFGGALEKIAREKAEAVRQVIVGQPPPLSGRPASAQIWDYILHASGLKPLIHPNQRFGLIPPRVSNAALASGAAPSRDVIEQNALWSCQVAPNQFNFVLTPRGASVLKKRGVLGVSLHPLSGLPAPPFTRAPGESQFANWSLCESERLELQDIHIWGVGVPSIYVSIKALEALLEAKINDTGVELIDSHLLAAAPA